MMKRGLPASRRRVTTVRRSTTLKKPLRSVPLLSSAAPRRIKNKLYVCGLLPTILREELIREFSPYGKLQEVWVAKKPPGFAFVEFVNARDAERVVHELDGAKILGSKVRIEFAKASKGPDEYKKLKKYPSIPGQSVIPSIMPPSEPLTKAPLLPGPPSGPLPFLATAPIPLGSTSAVKLGMMGPNDDVRKRRRYDSSGQADTSGHRPLLSPPPRRLSRSPVQRGRLLSPPPKRSLCSPEFHRKVDTSSFLPPPPSRRVNLSPMNKLPRPPEVTRRRYSKSPTELRQSGRVTSFGRNVRVVRSPIRWPSREGYQASPNKERHSTAGYNRNNSLDRLHNPSPHQRRQNNSLEKYDSRQDVMRHQGARTPESRSSSRGRDEDAVQKKMLVKSQIKSVASSIQVTKEWMNPEARSKNDKNSDSDLSKYSRSRSKEIGNEIIRRNSSPSKYKRTYSHVNENRQISRKRSLSKSSGKSEQRDSVSLRRNFQRNSWRRDSDGHSPPLNMSRTRLLGRTPPSPPVRSPLRNDKNERQNQEQFTVQSSARDTGKFKNKIVCRSPSKSYESDQSSVRKEMKMPTKVNKKQERSLSATSSHSKSGKIKQGRVKKMKRQSSSSSSSSSSASRSSRSSSPVQKKVPKTIQMPKKYVKTSSTIETHRSSSRYSDNHHPADKKFAHVSRAAKGGPRSPSESSMEKNSVNRSQSKSCSRSSESKSTSRGRRTPLAYQHRRESLSLDKIGGRNKIVKSPSSLKRSPHMVGDRGGSPRNRSPDLYAGARTRSYRSKYVSPTVHYPQHYGEEESRYRSYRKSSPGQRPMYFEEADRGFYGEPPSYHPSARNPPYMRGTEMPMRIRPGYYPGEIIPKDPYFRRHREFVPNVPVQPDYYRPGPRHYLLPPPVYSSYRGSSHFAPMSRGRYEGQSRPYHRNYEPYRGRIRNPPIFYDNSNKEKKNAKEE